MCLEPDDDNLDGLDRGDAVDAAAAAAAADAKPADPPVDPAAKEDADAGADTGADTDPDDDGTEAAVPYARFKKVNDRMKAAEQALLAARQPAAPATADTPDADPEEAALTALNARIDALYEEVEEARLDGDGKKAAALQRQLDAENRKLLRHEAEVVAKTAVQEDRTGAQYDAFVDVLEDKFPQLRVDDPDFDKELVAELNLLSRSLRSTMSNPIAALQKAAKLLGLDPYAAAPPPAAPPPPAPKEKPVDLKKAVDAANRQPPDAGKRGTNQDATHIDVTKLTDDEFDALPEAVKAKYRGDALA